mgnify:CR=1 FL=1
MSQQTLKARIRAKERLVGCFIKTPAPQVGEIIGLSGFDFAVVDQEHAPIGLADLDLMALAGRAVGLPLLARHFGQSYDWIAPTLDLGIDGVMVPRVTSRPEADAALDAAYFSRRKRGLSPSPRAGGYGGISLDPYRVASDARCIIALQIENHHALSALSQIVELDEVDLVFIGPSDLSQSLDVEPGSAELDAVIADVVSSCIDAGMAVGMYVSEPALIDTWACRGASFFVCGSDQSLLRQSAARVVSTGINR